MRSPFKFAQHGQCGTWVSDAMPHLARQVDDIAFIRSMYTTNLTHEPAIYLIQTGKMGPGRPTLGLVGRLRPRQREPEPAGLRRARRSAGPADQRRRELAGRLSAADLPGHAVPLDRLAGAEPASPTSTGPRTSSQAERDLLARLDAMHKRAAARPADLDARIASYELAARMQLAATDALDLSQESRGDAARCTASAASRPTPTAAAA